ncbi:MAG: DNA primase [Phycisphaerae bacterium]
MTARYSQPQHPSDGKRLVLEAADIVQVIQQTVTLKKQGGRYVGLCPFHGEKTPSFHVIPDKQFFHCFGCKAGGNVIDFVIKRDNLPFFDALKQLAKDFGVDLPSNRDEDRGPRDELLEAHALAADLYARILRSPAGEQARAYLKSRNFTDATLREWNIGYAPGGWDTLLSDAKLRRFNPALLAEGGLLKPRQQGQGFYDTFRERVMFPIRDEMGRVIAFGGRVLPGSDNPAKYLNSAETPLFSKSRVAFGLDRAKRAVAKSRTVAVVEGYTDVIMAHQCGVENVVSVLGTALTGEHARILRRLADRVVLLFDADSAGEGAADRSVELFLSQPVEIAVATLPPGVDPDEYVQKEGGEAFTRLLENASDALAYQWKRFQQQLGVTEGNLLAQERAVEAFLDKLAEAKAGAGGKVDALHFGAVLSRVSRLTGVPAEALNRRLGQSVRQRRNTARPDAPSQGAGAQADSPGGPKETNPAAVEKLTARIRVERDLLAALLARPALWEAAQRFVSPSEFSGERTRRLAQAFWDYSRNEGEVELNHLLEVLEEESVRQLALELAAESAGVEDPRQQAEEACEAFARFRQRADERQLVSSLRGQNEADEDSLLRKLQEQARRTDLTRI